jgi:hypothetical protein
MQETGAFVVQVLAVGDRDLAERFSEIRPPIRRFMFCFATGRSSLSLAVGATTVPAWSVPPR